MASAAYDHLPAMESDSEEEDTDAEEGQENSGKLYSYCASGG